MNNLVVYIDGKDRVCINDNGKRTETEQIEMMFRLFGYNKKPYDPDTTSRDDNDSKFVPFETNAVFDFSLFANGQLTIDSITDDIDVKQLLQKGVDHFKRRNNIHPNNNERRESIIVAPPVDAEVLEETEGERRAKQLLRVADTAIGNSVTKEQIQSAKSLKAEAESELRKNVNDVFKTIKDIIEQYRNQLISGLKTHKPDVSDGYLQMVTDMFNKIFTNKNISSIAKELEANNEVLKTKENIENFLVNSMSMKKLKEELQKLNLNTNVIVNNVTVDKSEQLAVAYTQEGEKNLATTYTDKVNLVGRAFNLQTIPSHVSEQDKQKIVNRVYNAFQNKELASSIVNMQQNPFFILAEFYDGNNFSIQSLQYSNTGAISNMVIKFTSEGAIFNPTC